MPERKETMPEVTNSAAMLSVAEDVMHLSNLYIHKDYLQSLDKMPILPASNEIIGIEVGKNLRILKINGILHEDNENLAEKIKSLFGAVSAFEAGVMLILQAKGHRAEFYIGICSNDSETTNLAFNTFTGSLKGILPGCKYRNVKMSEVGNLMEEIFPQKTLINGEKEKLAVAAVSAFPATSNLQQNENTYAAFEKIDVLLDAMRGKPFSMILLSKTMSKKILTTMQHQLELLYTQLSTFERQTISAGRSDTDSLSLNYSKAMTSNKNYSVGITRGTSHTHGESSQSSEQITDDQSRKMQAKLGLLGTAASLAVPLAAAAFTTGAGATALAGVLGSFYGAGISSMATNVGILSGVIDNPKSLSSMHGSHDDNTESESKNFSFSINQGSTDTEGYTVGNNQTNSFSSQYTVTNKGVSIILEELDREIHQMQRLSREGAFFSAAYFIAGNIENSVTAANIYRSMTDSKSADHSHKSSLIYRWNKDSEVESLIKYISRGFHPSFILNNEPHQPTAELAQIIGINDIPVYFSFPQKSVPGIVISDYASFSRDIIFQDSQKTDALSNRDVNIGCVYHFGQAETQTPINLKINELTKHLFISGATGVGKSNFCYQLLNQLVEQNIKVLVIEPAKGEYAGVFGGRKDFFVFGADLMKSPLLKINPFAFPKGISATQHIERLLGIFNTAWTMYDAMPAILKEAIEKIYLDKGFNLYFGGKPDSAQFPSFSDLLDALPVIIQNSSYSNEVKGNYTGALVTRVKSLTNGLYRMIFTQDEIGDEILFGENTIIDISRIGSSETKSLIMGILTMRLSEYRMCEGKVNSPLRHVTLLEEAHNILRRNNTASAGGGDLKNAAVEMLTNAIAEMRTAGEGFIIADQSPSVLDLSVIRNTHTKVFFMLPDKNDREISGDSLTLTEPQKKELARLSPGVSVVHQNGWTGAVLCKINHFKEENFQPFIYEVPEFFHDLKILTSQAMAVILSNLLPKGKSSSISLPIIQEICNSNESFSSEKAVAAMEILKEYNRNLEFKRSAAEYQQKISSLIPLKEILTETDDENWAAQVEEKICNEVSLNPDELSTLIKFGIRRCFSSVQFGKIFARYLKYKKSADG